MVSPNVTSVTPATGSTTKQRASTARAKASLDSGRSGSLRSTREHARRRNVSYWSAVTSSRVKRRRLLKTGSGLGIGALALSFIGCGGSDDKAKTPQDASGLATVPKDTANDGKAGGVWKHFARG